MRLLKNIFLSFSLFLTGCASAPLKPSVVLCVLNAEAQTASCGKTGMAEVILSDKPFSEMDKYIAFSPEDFEKLKSYQDVMQAYLHTVCQ